MKIPHQNLLLFILLHAGSLFSQVDPEIAARLEKRSHTFQNTTLPYRLYVPNDYSAEQNYPALIFLHGARWAGTDNSTQLDNELALYWLDSTFQAFNPCFLVYPQIPQGQIWEAAAGQVDEWPASPNLETANDIITHLLAEFSIDEHRINVSGKSIGALGVYGMIARFPDRYAAAIPAAGRYVFKSIEALSKCSLWIFHNRDDAAAPVSHSRFVVEQIEQSGESFVFTHFNFKTDSCDTLAHDAIDAAIQNGARFMYSEFDDAGHQLEPNVVATHGLYQWTMAQAKKTFSVRRILETSNFELIQHYPNPFNGSMTIRFVLPQRAHVNLKIKNITGRTIAVLENNQLEAGSHSYIWQAENNPSGVYFYQMSTEDAVHTGRCLLLK